MWELIQIGLSFSLVVLCFYGGWKAGYRNGYLEHDSQVRKNIRDHTPEIVRQLDEANALFKKVKDDNS